MASSTAPVFVPGVWGPYWNAMAPGLYLNEGGQSAAGSLIDHVVRTHPAHPELKAMAGICGVSETAALNLHLEVLRAKAGYADVAELGAAIHVGPDFLGNRSPLADHEMRGSLVGLRMATNTSLDDLATLYLGAVQSLAYQTRHIVETMQAAGHCPITSVVACGGLSKNKLYTATHANVLGLPVHLPEQEEAVLLGAAILGATAGGAHGSVNSAMRAMSKIGETVKPRTEASAFHERKYAVFRRMSDDQLEGLQAQERAGMVPQKSTLLHNGRLIEGKNEQDVPFLLSMLSSTDAAVLEASADALWKLAIGAPARAAVHKANGTRDL
eukprot:gene933-8134_t